MFKKILCPTDGSGHANKALNLAIDLVDKYDAELVILHVPQPSANVSALKRFAEVEGLAPQVNTEMDRLQTLDFRAPPTDTAFLESSISPRLLVEIGRYVVDGAKTRASAGGVERVEGLIETARCHASTA